MSIKLESVNMGWGGDHYHFDIDGKKTNAYDTDGDGVIDTLDAGHSVSEEVRKRMNDSIAAFRAGLADECAKAEKHLKNANKYHDSSCSITEWQRKSPDIHALDFGGYGHIDYVEFTDTKGVVTTISAFLKPARYFVSGTCDGPDFETRQQLSRYLDIFQNHFENIDDNQARNIWISSGISLYESISEDVYRPTFDESLEP